MTDETAKALEELAGDVVFHLALTVDLGRMKAADAIDMCTGALEMTQEQAEKLLDLAITNIHSERMEDEEA
ncbi:hypothetical protein E0L36_11315 [Streptomyces sp. AJS327]|uniref:hypothetical protein n=1 Tax=Streptomyces sp. AJS327 TaxID=2545265 RepID=UPI0015DE17D6|nr:hypothetical protein [Streptomyces sp. AJS327]MBA0051459.1 hypothetical protein [Streptomyces sp. AJS327]